MSRLVVVGGGIVGTMHALEAVERGWDVVHLEREDAPHGASVRNFGLVWVSGRATGSELALALDARTRWEAIASRHPGTGFRANGSLTLASNAPEEAVLEEVAAGADADARGFRLLGPLEVQAVNPAVGKVRAGLHCSKDAAVEPRSVLGALRDGCTASGRYHWCPGREVVDIGDHAVVDAYGTRYEGDLVVICTGAWHRGAIGSVLRDAPLRRVRLQMLETAPYPATVATSIADGDTLRYYPAYDVPARAALPLQSAIATAWSAQLLLVQRLDGRLTIGDTHMYEEPFPFDVEEAPYDHLLNVASTLLESTPPSVVRRWAGVYSQVTDPDMLYLRREVAAGVQLVTGPGGRGMTLAPAIAAETLR